MWLNIFISIYCYIILFLFYFSHVIRLFISAVLLSFFVFLSSHILPLLTEGVSEQGAKESIWTQVGRSSISLGLNFIMRNCVISFSYRRCSGGQMKKHEMGEACGTYGGEENVIQVSGWEN
jgi:hypothetical protein